VCEEGIRTRWCGRASNPVGDVRHSQISSTLVALRQKEAAVEGKGERTR
jgi:hypothetical protein